MVNAETMDSVNTSTTSEILETDSSTDGDLPSQSSSDTQRLQTTSASTSNEHDCCDDEQIEEPKNKQERCCDGSCDKCETHCTSSAAILLTSIDTHISSTSDSHNMLAQKTVKAPTQVDHPPIA